MTLTQTFGKGTLAMSFLKNEKRFVRIRALFTRVLPALMSIALAVWVYTCVYRWTGTLVGSNSPSVVLPVSTIILFLGTLAIWVSLIFPDQPRASGSHQVDASMIATR